MSEAQTQPFTGQGLAVLRGERLLFKQLAFSLEAGGVLLLRGANGSGKTTLLRILAGLTQPLAGSLTWGGHPVAELAEVYRRKVAYIGHRPGLKGDLTPRESLRFEAGLRGLPTAAVDQALDSLDLQSLADLAIKNLSAGQRRRVALARLGLGSLEAGAPELWLLDEPATALDSASEAALWRLCAQRLSEGARMVIATHSDVPLEGCQVLTFEPAA
ncbi:MAG: heme ABC exporter ATP-binding protein CcmA [Pseudomonadota bacterium]